VYRGTKGDPRALNAVPCARVRRARRLLPVQERRHRRHRPRRRGRLELRRRRRVRRRPGVRGRRLHQPRHRRDRRQLLGQPRLRHRAAVRAVRGVRAGRRRHRRHAVRLGRRLPAASCAASSTAWEAPARRPAPATSARAASAPTTAWPAWPAPPAGSATAPATRSRRSRRHLRRRREPVPRVLRAAAARPAPGRLLPAAVPQRPPGARRRHARSVRLPAPGADGARVDLVDLYADAGRGRLRRLRVGRRGVVPVLGAARLLVGGQDGAALFFVDITAPGAPGFGANRGREFGYDPGAASSPARTADAGQPRHRSARARPHLRRVDLDGGALGHRRGAEQDADLAAMLSATEPTDPIAGPRPGCATRTSARTSPPRAAASTPWPARRCSRWPTRPRWPRSSRPRSRRGRRR
jgi:hypothetical protein